MSTHVDADNAASRSAEEIIAELDELMDRQAEAQQKRFRSLIAMLAAVWVGLVLVFVLMMMQ